MKSCKLLVCLAVIGVVLVPRPVYGLTDGNSDHLVPADQSMRCPQWEGAFRRYGLKPVTVFSYIAWRESRCRIRAINGRWDKWGNLVWTLNANRSVDRGVLQVNSSWRTVTKRICGGNLDLLLTLDCNLRVSKYLLDNGGLAHWGM